MTTVTIISPFDSTKVTMPNLRAAEEHAHKGFFFGCQVIIHHNGQQVAEKPSGSGQLRWLIGTRKVR